MKVVVTAVWLGIAGMICVQSAAAQTSVTTVATAAKKRPAPAPMIGSGLPGVLIVVGALLHERSASDAQGPHLGRQRDLQQGSHDR